MNPILIWLTAHWNKLFDATLLVWVITIDASLVIYAIRTQSITRETSPHPLFSFAADILTLGLFPTLNQISRLITLLLIFSLILTAATILGWYLEPFYTTPSFSIVHL